MVRKLDIRWRSMINRQADLDAFAAVFRRNDTLKKVPDRKTITSIDKENIFNEDRTLQKLYKDGMAILQANQQSGFRHAVKASIKLCDSDRTDLSKDQDSFTSQAIEETEKEASKKGDEERNGSGSEEDSAKEEESEEEEEEEK